MIVIGIDIGTQSLKAVLTRGGDVLAEAQVAYDLEQPGAGWAQQDPRLWEEALGQVVPDVLALAAIDKAQVRALAVAAQLDGCVAVDAQCRPLSPCLVWMDRRAVDWVPDVPETRQRCTGLVFDASHMGAKIGWLKNHLGLTKARFHQPTSYLVERLCGAYVFDHGLASTSMLYDLRTRDYDDALLEDFGIGRDEVPAIADCEQLAGRLSEQGAALCGLVAGTAVAVGTGDDFATVLGAGIVEPGPMLVGLGTAEVVGTMSATLVVDDAALVETHGFLDGYFVQNPGWQSGGALRWVRTILNVASDAELDTLAAQVPAGCDGVTFLPALSGAMAPRWKPSARACFYGLASTHGRAHMARAVLEGCAFAMRDVRTRLQSMGLASGDIVLQGGGAQSAFWGQMRADLCQTTVQRQSTVSGSAMGASVLARAVANAAITLRELALESRPPSVEHAPDASVSPAYEDAYGRYRLLFDSLEPMF